MPLERTCAICLPGLPVITYGLWTVGSVVEHRLHTAGVTGSNPVPSIPDNHPNVRIRAKTAGFQYPTSVPLLQHHGMSMPPSPPGVRFESGASSFGFSFFTNMLAFTNFEWRSANSTTLPPE